MHAAGPGERQACGGPRTSSHGMTSVDLFGSSGLCMLAHDLMIFLLQPMHVIVISVCLGSVAMCLRRLTTIFSKEKTLKCISEHLQLDWAILFSYTSTNVEVPALNPHLSVHACMALKLSGLNLCISSARMDQGTTFYLAQGLFY